MKWILTLSVLTFLSSVLAVDYACPDGKSKKSITIKKDQTFNFDVAPGYGAKTKCSVMYKPSKSKKTKCKKLKFSCTTFDLPNKDAKKCRKGDKLRVGKQFFCKSKSPSIQSTKPIKLMFMSDKKDSSGSATCTIECVGSTPAPSPPTTTTGSAAQLSASDVDNIIQASRDTLRGELSTMVRLSFHDCVGGCDGCLNINNTENNGLADLVAGLEAVYQDNGFESLVSRADMWAILGVWAVQQTIDRSNENGVTVPNLQVNYTYGRVDCATAPYSSTIGNFPHATFNHNQIMSYFSQEFGFSTLEVTALMGAHTLGRANILNSGFHGTWVQDEAGLFNNKYFSNLVRESGIDWRLRQRTCENVLDDPSPCSEGQTTGWQYTTSGSVGFNLVADMAIYQNFTVDTDGRPDCDYSQCNLSETSSYVENFATSNEEFIQEFSKVYTKLLSHGYDNLQNVI